MALFEKEFFKLVLKKSKGDYNIVSTSRTPEEEKRNLFSSVKLSDLRKVTGLLHPVEKDMLEALLLNGNYITTCIYNKKGHIFNLPIGIKGEVPDFVKFPNLRELWTDYATEKSVEFAHQHNMAVKILRITGQFFTNIPDLSDFSHLNELDSYNNKLSEIINFGDLPNLRIIEIIQIELKAVKDFRKIIGCPNIE